jgi:phosphoribosylanthranilate isomerase
LCRAQKRIIQAFRDKGHHGQQSFDLANVEQYAVDAFMFDAYDPKLRGGTGRTSDWTMARKAARKLPRVFLAGGLSPENVATRLQPCGRTPSMLAAAREFAGKKDHALVRQFVARYGRVNCSRI